MYNIAFIIRGICTYRETKVWMEHTRRWS